MANKTIGELQAVPIGELPVAPDIYDDTLIPVEQNGAARHMTGAQWKAYGVAAAKAEADRAEQAAVRQPSIGSNGTWLVWDAQKGAYVDTDLPARGEKGGKGDKGDNGEPGEDGEDGFSPEVKVSETADGWNVVITTKDGEERFLLTHGKDGEDGLDGYTPVKGKDYFDGEDGEDGVDGITPHIGDNGNWWVDDKDTGVEATAGAAAAQEAAKQAEDAATSADSAALRASGFASTAARQADNASDYASDAAASATSAAKKAAAAEAAADDANLAKTAAKSAQAAAENAQAAAESAAIKQPRLSDNDTWMIWDAYAKEYVDTGLSAVGPQGPPGLSGTGSGDMLASVYDPQDKRKDIFRYVDDEIANLDIDVTADEVTFADGETFQQKYDSGELTGPEGPQGPAGGDGKDGKDGADGRTPVKGEDYYTYADKQEMVAAVLAALPAAEGAKF